MKGYTKLFSSIVSSTIWRESKETKILWITMLAMKNRDGVVEASVPGLADMARLSLDETVSALNQLLSPDPWSRSKEHDGRRIQEVDGGWVILNHAKYKRMLNLDERREYWRRKQAEYRAAKLGATPNVNEMSTESVTSHQSQYIPEYRYQIPDSTLEVPSKDTERGGKGGELFGAEAPSGVSAKKPRAVKTPFVKPTLEAWVAYAATVGLPKADAEGAYDHYETVGWVVGQGRKPMKNWEAAVRTCKRNYEERRQSGGRPSQRPLSPEEVRKQIISGPTPPVDIRAVIARRRAEREAAESGRVGGEVAQAPAVVPPSAGHGGSDAHLGLDLGSK